MTNHLKDGREYWTKHPDFPSYLVSTFSRLMRRKANGTYGRIRLGAKMSDGYRRHHLTERGVQGSVQAHVLMLEAFVGPSPGPEYVAAHGKNGITDNSLLNVSWRTHRQNCLEDRIRDGTINRGEKHGMSKITDADYRVLMQSGDSAKVLAARYDITVDYVYKLRAGFRRQGKVRSQQLGCYDVPKI